MVVEPVRANPAHRWHPIGNQGLRFAPECTCWRVGWSRPVRAHIRCPRTGSRIPREWVGPGRKGGGAQTGSVGRDFGAHDGMEQPGAHDEGIARPGLVDLQTRTERPNRLMPRGYDARRIGDVSCIPALGDRRRRSATEPSEIGAFAGAASAPGAPPQSHDPTAQQTPMGFRFTRNVLPMYPVYNVTDEPGPSPSEPCGPRSSEDEGPAARRTPPAGRRGSPPGRYGAPARPSGLG